MQSRNQIFHNGSKSSHTDVHFGPANRQMPFSGWGDEYFARKMPFSDTSRKKLRGPTILQLDIETLTASKMTIFQHLAEQLEVLVKLLQEIHCRKASYSQL